MNSAIILFEKTAARFASKVAVQDETGDMTFSALRGAARAVASGLLEDGLSGAAPVPVLVFLPKSCRALVCFLGALYAGEPYVPLDCAIPRSRLEHIAQGMERCRIITDAQGLAALEGAALGGAKIHLLDNLLQTPPRDAHIAARVDAVIDADLIYIMFTSGSTGVPKGVAIPHRGILDYAHWLRDTFAFDEHTVLGCQSAFYFDNSTLDIYTMCLTGATLILIPDVLFRYPSKLMDFVEDNGINTIFWVPTVMMAVANDNALAGRALPALQKVLFCGEIMPNKQLNVWRRALPGRLFANLYGPTEITDVCTYYVVDRDFSDTDPLPIGKACRNMRAVVLRDDGTHAAACETGELCIGGSGLARGYWGAAETTRAVFVQNPLCPFYDDRLYRTGDLAYFAEDGNLMYVGRMDSQIKHRGNRIELGEIETAARAVPQIKNACVLFDAQRQDIVLFAVFEQEMPLRKLNVVLKQTLPSYMVPTRLVALPAMPETPNGKIDRVTLKKQLLEESL